MRRLALLVLALLAGAAPLRATQLPGPGLGDAMIMAGPGCGAGCNGASLSTFMGETIDLLQFAPDRSGVADAGPAFVAAINLENAMIAAGTNACIRVPAGVYRIATTLPTLNGPGCVRGEGRSATFLKMDKSYAGALLSWSDAWLGAGNQYDSGANTLVPAFARGSPAVEHLTITGDRSAASPQHGIVFYDHADYGLVNDIDVFYVTGSALATGRALHDSDAYVRETHIEHFRTFYAGSASFPAIDINSLTVNGDATNEIRLDAIDVFAPFGTGLAIHGVNTRNITGQGIRVEGLQNGTVAADLIKIGDPTLPGSVFSINLHGLELISPYAGYAAIHLTGSTTANMYDIDLEGWIGGGLPNGRGLQLDVGRSSAFHFPFIYTKDTNVVIGPNAGIDNLFDGGGTERYWTMTNASTTPISFMTPSINFAPPATLGLDIQTSHPTAQQTATGQSAVAAGVGNTASGANSAAIGSYNTASGTGAVALGRGGTASGNGSYVYGAGANDLGRNFYTGTASGGFVQQGTQILSAVATGTGSTAVTAFGGSCVGVPDKAAYGLKINMVARDITTPGNTFSWSLPSGVLARDAGVGTTFFAGATPATASSGSGSGASVQTGYNTGTGCLIFGFTPPSGNTDTWHIGGIVETVEVQ